MVRSPRMPRPLLALLTAATIVSSVVALADFDGALAEVGKDWALAAMLSASAAAVLWRAATVSAERLAWSVLGLGLTLYALGNVVFNLWVRDAAGAPFPSVADALWAALPLSATAAMCVIGRARGLLLTPTSVLDGLICTLALTALCGALVYEPVFDQVIAEGVTYGLLPPLYDLGVVGVCLVGAAARGWRPHRVTVLLGVAFVLVAVGDGIYVVQAATDGYASGSWRDLPFIAATALVAAAAWAPPGVSDRIEACDVRVLSLPLTAGGIGVVLSAVAVRAPLNAVAEYATVLLMTGVVIRLAFAMRGYGALLESTRLEAGTDALTGLPNRRRLFAELGELDRPAVLALFDLDGFKAFNDRLGHGAGDELLARLGARLATAVEPHGRAFRMGGDEFCVLVDAATAGTAVSLAAEALSGTFEGLPITCSWGTVDLPAEAVGAVDALRVADGRMYNVKNGRPTSAGSQLREALVRVLDVREPELHEHVRDVGRLAADVARRLGLREHEVTDIVHGAELHDIGKLAVPEAILRKPGPLDDDEWAVMRLHTIHGEQLLAGIPALATAATLVRSSHERWDGGGYPDGLAGTDIPVGARIIAVCDAYDAIVTDRPYRRAATPAEAIDELRRCAGGQFDPAVVEAFVALVAAQPAPALAR